MADADWIEGLPRVRVQGGPLSLDTLVDAAEPLILTGLLDTWPALAAGRAGTLPRYLKALDQGMPAPVMEAPAASGGHFAYGPDLREFSFTKRQGNISGVLDRIEALVGRANAPFVAMQMLPLASHLPSFAAQNPMPLMPHAMPRLWIGGAVHTRTHNDRDHNLACVIAGRRRFLLFPPDQVAHLYVGPLDNPPPLSLVDPEAPDLDSFPRFADAMAKAHVADLEPGDTLFLPRYWWHHVISRDPVNAMVNYWWGDRPPGLDNPNDCFLAALLALKGLPAAERAYWKAMFALHVFDQPAEATEHIPATLKGALGPMPPSARAALKQQLRTVMSRP